jgi:hypothetical protein
MVIAILNFIFGGLGLIGSLCGGVAFVVGAALLQSLPPGPAGTPNPAQELTKFFQSIPGYIPFMIVSLILGAIMGVVLIVAGVGLLQMRNWGRITSIVYAIAMIIISLFNLGYNLAVVSPAMAKFQEEMLAKAAKAGPGAPPAPNPGGQIGGAIGGVFGLIFSIAYSVVILIVLNLPGIRRAFARAGSGDRRGDDLDDEVARRWGDDDPPPGERRGRLPRDEDRFRSE